MYGTSIFKTWWRHAFLGPDGINMHQHASTINASHQSNELPRRCLTSPPRCLTSCQRSWSRICRHTWMRPPESSVMGFAIGFAMSWAVMVNEWCLLHIIHQSFTNHSQSYIIILNGGNGWLKSWLIHWWLMVHSSGYIDDQLSFWNTSGTPGRWLLITKLVVTI